MEHQWMNHPIFTIESWSVYGLTIRTNNDCEGWHNKLNRKAGGLSLSFYRLVPVLQCEAEEVSYELRHLRDGISTRRVRPAARKIGEKIRELWKNYSAGNIQTSELLEGCASVYGPQSEE
ncbi:uncharacterized protein LOC132728071 [Ruditapes philippinarum]|uniref:uncharacterized protein LOC132728071 n=1 Tax=Ruditapes philippinarum TaxID=129788 RepID=UPI00295AB2EF|nr:uncharacterized protein LOC132728071 [Ruditapes philippinarum]